MTALNAWSDVQLKQNSVEVPDVIRPDCALAMYRQLSAQFQAKIESKEVPDGGQRVRHGLQQQ
jgi:hypothetical protein